MLGLIQLSDRCSLVEDSDCGVQCIQQTQYIYYSYPYLPTESNRKEILVYRDIIQKRTKDEWMKTCIRYSWEKVGAKGRKSVVHLKQDRVMKWIRPRDEANTKVGIVISTDPFVQMRSLKEAIRQFLMRYNKGKLHTRRSAAFHQFVCCRILGTRNISCHVYQEINRLRSMSLNMRTSSVVTKLIATPLRPNRPPRPMRWM